MQLYTNNVQDRSGNAITGASILVRKNGANATIFADDGTTALSNPFYTDEDGEFRFYAASGTYDVTVDSSKLPAPIEFPGVILFDPDDVNAPLREELVATDGAALVGFDWAPVPAAINKTDWGVQTSRNGVSALRFIPPAQWTAIQSGTSSYDCTADLQAWINAICKDTPDAPAGYLPAGRYRKTGVLTIPRQYITIKGDGMWASTIETVGSGVKGMAVAAIAYLRPTFSDFSLRSFGATNTGNTLDFDAITTEVYLGSLSNMYLEGGGVGLAARRYFSMSNTNIAATSYNDHSFRVSCGPGVTWSSCYAVECGAGKAGYRFKGSIVMTGCNGLNAGDWWGIFGQDTTATDGYQADFVGAGDDFPDVTLINCNQEEFASKSTSGGGTMLHNTYRSCQIIGGKIDRNNLSTAYKALVYARKGSNSSGQPIRLSLGAVFKGTGTPSLAYLHADESASFFDENSTFIGAGISTYRVLSDGLSYPLLQDGSTGDVYGDVAFTYNAIAPRRMTAQVIRFKEIAVTTVPATVDHTPIDVTGTQAFVERVAATVTSVTPSTRQMVLTATGLVNQRGVVVYEYA